MRYDEDASLQRWGRNLATVAPALQELATNARVAEDQAAAAAQALGRIASQGDSELPADHPLVAELEDIQRELAQINAEPVSARFGALVDRAEALTRTYRTRHEVDEERLAGGRGGRAREKRADVTTAEQDT
jgi:hypothetical protein